MPELQNIKWNRRTRPEFTVTGLRGFDYFFTERSKNLTVPDAILWPETRDAILLSAREATGTCIALKGEDYGDTAQATRTGIAYYKDGQKYFMAFDDIRDCERNIVLAQAHQRLTPELVKEHIRRAERTGRIAEVPEQSPIELSLTSKPGFAESQTIQALLRGTESPPFDMAELRAADLRERHGRDKTYLHTRTIEELKKLGIEGDKTEICVAILDVDNHWNSKGIDARCKYDTKEKFCCSCGIYNAAKPR